MVAIDEKYMSRWLLIMINLCLGSRYLHMKEIVCVCVEKGRGLTGHFAIAAQALHSLYFIDVTI